MRRKAPRDVSAATRKRHLPPLIVRERSRSARPVRLARDELLNDFVGPQQQGLWNHDAERVGGLAIDDQLDFRR